MSTASVLLRVAPAGTRSARPVPGALSALVRALVAEVRKLKRTLAAWMVIIAPLLVIVFTAFIRLASTPEQTSEDAWPGLVGNVLAIWSIIMLPLFVALEAALDRFNEGVPPLKEFILPGGGVAAASCHLGRATCRRAERRCWTLARAQTVAAEPLQYLNRLSDLLFVIARVLARHETGSEVLWKHERR